MPYGVANHQGPPDDAELIRMLERAREAGVDTIDTARAYGAAEARIGQALPRVPGPRRWHVITKLAPDVHDMGVELTESLERVAASLAASREALGIDPPPDLLLHRFAHRSAEAGRLWGALLAERDAGRIGRLGISAANPEEAWAALDDPDVQILQVASSLLDLRLFRQGFFARARALGRTVYVRSVFLQGVAHLEPAHLPAFLAPLRAPIAMIHDRARRLGVPPRALFLAFARDLLPGVHPVIGCEREDQLDELLQDWADARLDHATIQSLVESLPTLEARLVDPSLWPKADAADTPRRTTCQTAATLPR
jgi:aryl-alcohol dehydrogenase-like predicted oxidoreductase